MPEPNFMGHEFIWFHCFVENRQDPDMLGKVQVRILGFHNPDKSFLPTDQLLWAYIMMPVNSASISGIGTSPNGIVPGSWCIGFFRDGSACQDPIIIGTIGGIPQLAANPSLGFNDPRNDSELTETLQTAPRHIATRKYPIDGSGAQLENASQGENYPLVNQLGEADTNRIARNQNIDKTILSVVKQIIDTNVPIAFGGTWSESPLFYNGIYPYTIVQEFEAGSVKVIDNTPGHEGQLDIDRSGTSTQIQTDGSKVEKIVKNGYTIIMSDNHVHVMGNEFARTDHEYNLSVGGRWNLEVSGNINIKSGSGGLYLSVAGDANISSSGKLNLESSGDTNVKATGNINIGCDIGKISMDALALNVKAKTAILLDAPLLSLNSGKALTIKPVSSDKPKA